MKCIGITLLISAYIVSGCASPEPTLESATAIDIPPPQQQSEAGKSPDIALPASEAPKLPREAKPLRPSLLGATYIKRSSLPKVVANNWKVFTPLVVGKEGDTDVFVIEKKSRKRLVLATSEKRVLRNFYRYSIKSELELPNAEVNAVLAQCTSTDLLPTDEFAVLNLASDVKIVWLARRNSARLNVEGKKRENHLCAFTLAGVEQKKQLTW